MGNRFQRVFNPTPEEQIEDNLQMIEMFSPLYKERGCSTCLHLEHVIDYPGFVTGEECICKVGLKCDTVLDSVKNCPKWMNDRAIVKLKRRNAELERMIGNRLKGEEQE